jgi:hypothetical protein
MLLFLQLLPLLKTSRFVRMHSLFIPTELQLSVITVEKCSGGWCGRALNVKVSFFPCQVNCMLNLYACVALFTTVYLVPWMYSLGIWGVHGFILGYFVQYLNFCKHSWPDLKTLILTSFLLSDV